MNNAPKPSKLDEIFKKLEAKVEMSLPYAQAKADFLALIEEVIHEVDSFSYQSQDTQDLIRILLKKVRAL